MKNQRFVTRLGFAASGITATYHREKSLKVHAAAVVFITVFCVWQRPEPIWCAVFFGVAGLVICLELLNSAVEAVIDRLHPEIHPEIGYAKDVLAGAVLVASLASLVIFGFYIFQQIGRS